MNVRSNRVKSFFGGGVDESSRLGCRASASGLASSRSTRPWSFGFLGFQKLDCLATPRAELNLPRKATGETAAFGKDTDRPGAVRSVNERTKCALQLFATDFHLGPRGSFHRLIRSQSEPLLDAIFLDAPIAASPEVFELQHVSRDRQELQFIVVIIGTTLERHPF